MGIIRTMGILVFMYLTWRNLKDSYKEKQLITYTWMGLLGLMIGGRLVYGLINWGLWNENPIDWIMVWQKPGINYFGAYMALIGVTILLAKYFGWKLWSFFEDNSVNIAILFIGFLGDEFFRSGMDKRALFNMLAIFDGMVAVLYFKNKYRSLVWYKSGKKGFLFWVGNVVLWLMMAGFSFLLKDKIIITLGYLVLSLISGLGLVILGEVLTLMVKKPRKKNE